MKKQEAKKDLSVVIPTFNCETELINCLKSVMWADEIIVIDMRSTDRTLELAEKYNAKIFTRFPTNGNFDSNRKFGMQKATGRWILKLDSDEVLSEKLQENIKNFLSQNDETVNGMNLYNRIFMFGGQVKHGFVKSNSHELRLVRNGKWHYNPIRFHQQITVDGEVGYIDSYYDHYNYRNIFEFILKTNKYTTIDAKFIAKNKRATVVEVVFAPIKTFVKLYFIQLGLLDGVLGITTSFLFALYNLIEKTKVWELTYT